MCSAKCMPLSDPSYNPNASSLLTGVNVDRRARDAAKRRGQLHV